METRGGKPFEPAPTPEKTVAAVFALNLACDNTMFFAAGLPPPTGVVVGEIACMQMFPPAQIHPRHHHHL
jgi:hypothetical protein